MHCLRGEFAKEGIWIPKEYEGSFGSNGYHLDFADSSALGNDVSGNNNDWTSSGGLLATDVVSDTPENNFSTLNSLKVNTQTQTFAQGNLDFSATQTSTNPQLQTHLLDHGKWYWEVYIRAKGNDANSVGIASNPNDLENDLSALYLKDTAYSYQPAATNETDSSYGDTWDTGDIIGVALDLDAGAVYFYKNGSIQNSGDAACIY